MAIPILAVSDLDVGEAFYARLGYDVADRFDGYLVLHDGPVELHLSHRPGRAVHPATCFVHVGDATAFWKQLMERGVPAVTAPVAQDYGLVEFDVTDPDGNRIRFGSPAG
jgi:catechol 2,3-dioxygenase-like lactoylglutathione lyase family enzyme